jgi:hypothetical protein
MDGRYGSGLESNLSSFSIYLVLVNFDLLRFKAFIYIEHSVGDAHVNHHSIYPVNRISHQLIFKSLTMAEQGLFSPWIKLMSFATSTRQ